MSRFARKRFLRAFYCRCWEVRLFIQEKRSGCNTACLYCCCIRTCKCWRRTVSFLWSFMLRSIPLVSHLKFWICVVPLMMKGRRLSTDWCFIEVFKVCIRSHQLFFWFIWILSPRRIIWARWKDRWYVLLGESELLNLNFYA